MGHLDNYDVSIHKFLSERVKLTDEAKKEQAITDIIVGIKDLNYTRQEIMDALYIYGKLVESLKDNEEAQNYIKINSVDKLGNMDRGYDTLEAMGEAIRDLYGKMINNIYIISASEDYAKREEEYNILLKGFRLLAEIIQDISPTTIELVGNLAMVADLNFVCVSGWKDTLTELLGGYREKVIEKLSNKINISQETDPIKKKLDEVFFKASEKVVKDLSYDFIDLYYIQDALRPHCIEIIKKFMNKRYDFKIANMNINDNYMPEGSEEEQSILKNFIEYLNGKSVNELVVFEACKRYKDILNSDNMARQDVADWAIGYLEKNGKKEKIDGMTQFVLEKGEKKEAFSDAGHFLMEYVFCEDLKTVRNIAIEEIMRDRGYITKTPVFLECTDYNKALKIEKALKYSEREGELEFIKNEIQDMIKNKEIDNRVIFDASMNYENYGEIIDLLLKEPLYRDLKDEMLVFMANKGDTNRLKILLKKNADINARVGRKSNTALIEAVQYNNKEITKILLSHNANMNLRNNEYKTALEISAINGNYDIAKYLLDSGANVNEDVVDYVDILDNINMTNIVSKIRCTKENSELIKLFIQKGADIWSKSLINENVRVLPIVKACLEDNREIVELLVKNGQDMKAIDELYSSRWFFEREDWVKEIYKNYQKYSKDASIKKALREMKELKKACSNNDLENVKKILRLDSCVGYRRVALKILANVDTKNKAIEREQLKKDILDELCVLDSDNYLQWAVNTKDEKIVDLLIKTQKISIKDLEDKCILKLSENVNNERITNMLTAYKDLMIQLEKNKLKDVTRRRSSLELK